MWLFRRRRKVPVARGALRKLVAGLIIGGAIGSIVGSKVLEKVQEESREKNNGAKKSEGGDKQP